MEEAERWREQMLQPVPRRLFRYLVLTNEAARVWMGSEVMQFPAARVTQYAFMPVIRKLAGVSHARLLYPGWAGPVPRGLPACPLPSGRGGSAGIS